MNKNTIKVADYAKQEGVSRGTVYRWIERGYIKSEVVRGKVHIVLGDKIPA